MKKGLLIVEITVILAYVLTIILFHNSRCKEVEGFSIDSFSSDVAEFKDGNWTIDPQRINVKEEKLIMLTGPNKRLKKGSYIISVCYNADADQICNAYVKDDDRGILLDGGEYILDKNKEKDNFRFETRTDINEAGVQFWYNGDGSFTIHDVKLYSDDANLRRGIVYLAFLLMILDFILLFRKLPENRKREWIVIIGITAVSSLPVLYKGLNDNEHDLLFHLMRIEGLTEEIRLGHIPSRLQSIWNGGYGYPVSIYYGDLFLYFPALLRICGISINIAFKAYIVVINFLTLVFSFICFSKMFKDRSLSLLLSVVFLISPYRLMDVYVRNALGEYTSMMFFPLIALALYRIYSDDRQSIQRTIISGVILALGMTGIINTHVLTSEMVVYVMAAVFVLMWKKSIKPETIIAYSVGIITSLLLSLYFIVPFVDYYLNTTIKVASYRIQYHGVSIADYFAFFKSPFGNSPYMQYTPGMVLMVVLIMAIRICMEKRANGRIKLLTFLSVVLLWVASNIFPWDVMAYSFRPFRLITFVQFPWRYIGIVSFILTILFGEVINSDVYRKINNKKSFMVIGSVAMLFFFLFLSQYGEEANRTVIYDKGNFGTYNTMGGEYTRVLKADKQVIYTDIEKYDGRIHGKFDCFEMLDRKGNEMSFHVKTGNDMTDVVLPLSNYPGYSIVDNHGCKYEIRDSDNFLISFTLPENFEGDIEVKYVIPWYWTMALAVSIISCIIVAVYFFLCGSKKEDKQR